MREKKSAYGKRVFHVGLALKLGQDLGRVWCQHLADMGTGACYRYDHNPVLVPSFPSSSALSRLGANRAIPFAGPHSSDLLWAQN